MSSNRLPSRRGDIACVIAVDLAGGLPSEEASEMVQSFKQFVEIGVDIRFGCAVRDAHRRCIDPVAAIRRPPRARDASS
jgi:hypothetical protein